MFVVRRGNDTYYTRDGAFEFDAVGNYVLPGSGHFVQGWMAKDGIIDTNSAIEDIKVTKGQPLFNPTDLVYCIDNLGADVPTIKEISVIDNKSYYVGFSGKEVGIKGIPVNGKTWSFKNDVPLGAESADIVDEDGLVATVKLSPAAQFEIPKGTDVDFGSLGILTKGSVIAEYPLILNIDGKQYKAVSMNTDMDTTKKWSLKSGGAKAGTSNITITDGTNDITFTLDSALQETIGEIQLSKVVASPENPATITLSDGTTVVKTDGTYEVGTSVPIATTTTVYDNNGAAYTLPLYFIRQASGDTEGKWLVSITPDTSVEKGQNVTAEATDANGKTITMSFPVAEIRFDENGNLVINSESDTNGILSFGG